jgi:hypothetical protein
MKMPLTQFTPQDAQRAVATEYKLRFRARPSAFDLDIVAELEDEVEQTINQALHSKMHAWGMECKKAVAELRKAIEEGPAVSLTAADLKKLNGLKLG